jgi:hypothetical protein
MSMVWIAGATAGVGGVGSFELASIPQTFTHLQLRLTGRSKNTGGSFATVYGGFNDEVFSGTNYTNHFFYGEGTSTSSSGQASQGQMNIGGGQFVWDAVLANSQGVVIADILDYTNTNKNKTVRYLMGWDGNGSGRAMLGSTLWMQTAAINKITVLPDAGFAQFSRVDLYGITSSLVTGA